MKKTNETSTRKQALEWWRNLAYSEQLETMSRSNFEHFRHASLTGREIQIIWNKEVNGECTKCGQTTQNCECHIPVEEKHLGLFNIHRWLNLSKEDLEIILPKKKLPDYCKQPEVCGKSLSGKCICPRPSAKEFKEFDPKLFKAYIDKFSGDDKMKAFTFLFNELLALGYLGELREVTEEIIPHI